MSYKYDVFISYASEDRWFAEKIAKSLQNRALYVWLDQWELRPSLHLLKQLNEGLKNSRYIVSIFSNSYFSKSKKGWTEEELYAGIYSDINKKERRLIPLILEKCEIPPLISNIISIDCTNYKEDYEIIIIKLYQVISNILPRDPNVSFLDQVRKIYTVAGYNIVNIDDIDKNEIFLPKELEEKIFFIEQEFKFVGTIIKAMIICEDKEVDEVGQYIDLNKYIKSQRYLEYKKIIVSSKGYMLDETTLKNLLTFKVSCKKYAELLYELFPLSEYVKQKKIDYENKVKNKWGGKDCFIRPYIRPDLNSYNQELSDSYFYRWFDDEKLSFLLILGNLGTGKTTLSEFLFYDLAKMFMDDPVNHPAPVLIEIKDIRKEVSLEGMILNYFARQGIKNVNFENFMYLLKQKKIVLFFDAFDEMADRLSWEIIQSNFNELCKSFRNGGKVVMTCRTHYFKDRNEQNLLIEDAWNRLSETEMFKNLKSNEGVDVVYLQEFNNDQISWYVQKVRPDSYEEDLTTIKKIHNLHQLAQRPLLLDMIVQTLPDIKTSTGITAVTIYEKFIKKWIVREETEKRINKSLNEKQTLSFLQDLAWEIWHSKKNEIHFDQIKVFVKKYLAKSHFDEKNLNKYVGEIIISTLKRDDDGNFSFMHYSFFEFFLAKKIFNSLKNKKNYKHVLNTVRFERKVIYFLFLMNKEINCVIESLQQILIAGYDKNVSENALQILYWIARYSCEMEDTVTDIEKLQKKTGVLIPRKIVLNRANLKEIVLEAADLRSINFQNSDLTRANLNNTLLKKENFEHAKLDGAQLNNTIFDPKIQLNKNSFKPALQLWHNSPVCSVCYSPKNSFIASGDEDGRIIIYDVNKEFILYQFEGHKNSVNSMHFSTDGFTLVSGSSDQSIRGWNIKKGNEYFVQNRNNSIRAVKLSHDNKTLASASDDQKIYLWDFKQIKKGKIYKTLRESIYSVDSIDFSKKDHYLAFAGEDKVLRLYKNDKTINHLRGHHGFIRSVRFSPDGKHIASGSNDKLIRLWNVKKGNTTFTFEGHKEFVRAVAFSPDNYILASGSNDQTIRLWNIQEGDITHIFKGHQGYVRSLDFSPDGKYLLSGSSDRTVRLWDIINKSEFKNFYGFKERTRSVEFSPDGNVLAVGTNFQAIRIWDIKNIEEIKILKGSQGKMQNIAFSPEGTALVSGGTDNTVCIWDIEHKDIIKVFKGHQDAVRTVDFSSDGKSIASGANDKTVRLWDLRENGSHKIFEGHRHAILSVKYSPDNKMIASTSNDRTVRLWNTVNFEKNHILKGHTKPVNQVIFLPDHLVVSGSIDHTIRIWDITENRTIKTLKGHTNSVLSLDFSPDGKYIASGSSDQTIRIWERETGKIYNVLEGHKGEIYSVKFSKNNKYLIAACPGCLQFWDPYSGHIFLYRYYFGPGAWLDLLPDGQFNASSEGSRFLRYTEIKTLKSYSAKTLEKEFYNPKKIKAILKKYCS